MNLTCDICGKVLPEEEFWDDRCEPCAKGSQAPGGAEGMDVATRIEALRAQVAKLEAEAGAMRTAGKLLDYELSCTFWTSADGMNQEQGGPQDVDIRLGKAWEGLQEALATDAGASLLARLRAAEADSAMLDLLDSQPVDIVEATNCVSITIIISPGESVRQAITAMSPQPEEGR